MAKKRKTKKPTVKRSKATRDVDVFTPDVSDEALERAAAGSPCSVGTIIGTITGSGCVMVAVDNLKMLIQLDTEQKSLRGLHEDGWGPVTCRGLSLSGLI